jgi:hypothetical protein
MFRHVPHLLCVCIDTFSRVIVDIPSFEAEVSASPTFDQRYVVGWKATTWNLQEEFDSITGERNEEPQFLVYAKSSCSSTLIVPCRRPTDPRDFVSKFLSGPRASFFAPMVIWYKEALEAPRGSASYVRTRATNESDPFTSAFVIGNDGLFISFQRSLSSLNLRGKKGGGMVGGQPITTSQSLELHRSLLSDEDEECIEMCIDNTWDLNACGTIDTEEGLWAKGQMDMVENRSKDAVLLQPAVDEKLFAEGHIDGHSTKNEAVRSYYTITAPLELRLDG